MELSIKYVVTATVIIIVLVVLSFFLTSTSSLQISRSDANFVFSTKCQEYAKQDCVWSATEDKEFRKYVSACRQLFGDKQGDKACLYTHCPACKNIELKDLECSGLCDLCRSSAPGFPLGECCAQFRQNCGFETGLCNDVCPS